MIKSILTLVVCFSFSLNLAQAQEPNFCEWYKPTLFITKDKEMNIMVAHREYRLGLTIGISILRGIKDEIQINGMMNDVIYYEQCFPTYPGTDSNYSVEEFEKVKKFVERTRKKPNKVGCESYISILRSEEDIKQIEPYFGDEKTKKRLENVLTKINKESNSVAFTNAQNFLNEIAYYNNCIKKIDKK